MLDKKIIEKIKKEVGRQFPAFKGVKPRVIKKKIPPQKGVYRKLSLEVINTTRTVFSFKFVKKIRLERNVSINQILLITTDEHGEIIKISQSK